MKRVLVISLLLILLLQTFGKLFILVDYQVNKEYIMAFLCINRDKPELQCEGKCHLKKELKKHDEAEKQSEERSQKQDAPVQLYCQELFQLQDLLVAGSCLPVPLHQAGFPVKTAGAVFHPPQYIV